jgi:hypothetical protein
VPGDWRLAIWRSGDLAIWRSGDLAIWRSGDLAIWHQHNGANNGKIPYGRRDVQHDLGCGSTQATRYLREAQERGFIAPTRRGAFDWKNGRTSGKGDDLADHNGALRRGGSHQRPGSLDSAR